MKKSIIIVIAFHVCLALIILGFIYTFKPNTVENVLIKSFNQSKMSKHNIDIYDNSTNDVIDKLLIVNPYGWIFWNYDGALYIVDPNSNIFCSQGFGVYKIPSAVNLSFQQTCANGYLTDLLHFYMTKGKSQNIPFEATARYTILNCIEFLSNGHVYLKTNGNNNKTNKTTFSALKVYNSINSLANNEQL